MNKTELEERLIDFAVSIIEIVNELPATKAGNHLAGQLVRSGTSPALNYGEARSAESRRDFIHKLQVALKELRETLVALKIIFRAKLHKYEDKFQQTLAECNELISIFVRSVQTTHKR